MKVLVTGGCGYIGVHTIVDLFRQGFEAISVDDNSRSSPEILKGAEQICNTKISHHPVNLCDLAATEEIFRQEQDIEAVIHFAAYKEVFESVSQPLLYYQNNLLSLVNILKCIAEFQVPHLIFSSSASVYGNAKELPVTEDTPFGKVESPYANTKKMGEEIIQDFHRASAGKHALLRYFNPVGAHPSGLIGETPYHSPNNLVPVITQTAIGKRNQELVVYGNDYSTRDGTCIRDYIHVMDIARAHTQAVKYLMAHSQDSCCEVFNLGTGRGVTVLEAIQAFEKVSGGKLHYRMGSRRAGDIAAIYANNDRAKQILEWEPKHSLEEMMESAWKWEQKLQQMTTS